MPNDEVQFDGGDLAITLPLSLTDLGLAYASSHDLQSKSYESGYHWIEQKSVLVLPNVEARLDD